MGTVITVRETAPHDPKFAAGSENYGADYMARVSVKTAAKLCGMYPVPKVGYETVVAVSRGKERLYVSNLGGHFFVRCASAQIIYWPATFGIAVKRFGE